MAGNFIRSNGDAEFDVACDLDPGKYDVGSGKCDVAGHVSRYLSGFFFQIHVCEDVTRNTVVFSKTFQADVEMSDLISMITLPGF